MLDLSSNPTLSAIQQHVNNGAVALADEAAKAAGLLVTVCLSCDRLKSAVEAAHPGLSHGLCIGACVQAYRAKYGRGAA